jgi:hypothetical protein
MPGPLSIVVPLILAGVLIASGIAKLRRPDDLASWADLGVPKVFQREWLRRFHPWGELALALSLALLGGPLGMTAALVALALMGAYLWLVWRAYLREPDSSCACFGSRAPITRRTIARNVWLTLLAAVAVAVIGASPLFGGAVAAIGPGDVLWVLAVAAAAVTAVLVVASEATPTAEAAENAGPASPATMPVAGQERDDELEYVRLRTPAVPVTLGDGTVVSLRDLAARKPILLLAVSPTCEPCSPVIEKIGEWRALLPEVDVRFLLTHEPGRSALTETTEPQSLHDPHKYVRDSIGRWNTPTAVLLGADGMLAGGPVTGFQDISDFVADVHDSLAEARAAMGL